MVISNKIRNSIAVLFLTAFIGTLLVKPLHLLSHDHSHTCLSEKSANPDKSNHPHDCGICHFSLSAYTFQELPTFNARIDVPETIIIGKEYHYTSQEVVILPSLRGPPIV